MAAPAAALQPGPHAQGHWPISAVAERRRATGDVARPTESGAKSASQGYSLRLTKSVMRRARAFHIRASAITWQTDASGTWRPRPAGREPVKLPQCGARHPERIIALDAPRRYPIATEPHIDTTGSSLSGVQALARNAGGNRLYTRIRTHRRILCAPVHATYMSRRPLARSPTHASKLSADLPVAIPALTNKQ